MSNPIGPLLFTVVTSILEVFLLCLAGYILAGRGILDKKTQKQLNRLNVSLFTPSLLFSKVAFFLSPAKLRELWIIPIFFVVVTLVSMSVAFTLGWIFRLKRSQRSFAMAAAMFMNSNSLPIALMQSLVVTVPGLKWGKDDNKNAMVGRALTYLVLYSTLGMVLRWSYGVKLLTQADDEADLTSTDQDDETRPLLESAPERNYTQPANGIPPIVVHESPTRPQANRRRSKFYNSFPNSPNLSRVNLNDSESPSTSASTFVSSSPVSSEDEDDEATIQPPPAAAPALPTHVRRQSLRRRSTYVEPPTFYRRCKRTIRRSWMAINDFMTVPLWAALASIIVACVRPLQHALEAHMQPIKGALASAGNCSIPLTLIVLGAYFYPPPKDENENQSVSTERPAHKTLRNTPSTSALISSVKAMFNGKTSASPQRRPDEISRPGETKTVVIAIASRMIITPILLLPVIALSAKFDLQRVFDDPVFVVANVLLISSPPALTLAQITQAASGDAFERLISRTIFWAYCIITPPATITYVLFGLVLSKL